MIIDEILYNHKRLNVTFGPNGQFKGQYFQYLLFTIVLIKDNQTFVIELCQLFKYVLNDLEILGILS